MSVALPRRRVAAVAALVAVPLVLTANSSRDGAPAAPRFVHRGLFNMVAAPGDESVERVRADEQFNSARSAPGGIVSPSAYNSAWSQVETMTPVGGSWAEVTTKNYNGDSPDYRDPVWSNSSGGAGYQTGRITGLATDGTFVYAAGGNGGVFRRPVGANTAWTPIADTLASLSGGDLKINPTDGSLWFASGEGNTGASSVVGSGVYRLANPRTSSFAEADKVGPGALEGAIINKIQFDGVGRVYVATQRGLWRHSAAAGSVGSPWTQVFDPPDQSGLNAAYSNIINDVTFQPGTNGRTILVNAAWRAGASYNGFYISRDAGATWTKANPGGAINPKEIGNAEFAYSADGKKLYTVVESIFLYNKGIQNGSSVLAGVYASNNGSVDGPSTLIADYKKLQQSGSALFYKGFAPGVQAWYNNFIAVDPKNANHVYLGLEEVFETWNGGSNWTATGRYWNFGFSCWSFDDAANTCDGNVMHSDQHSIAFTPDGSKVFVGNDGGVYSKSTSTKVGWTNYNKNGLNTLQYYGVGAGRVGSAVAVSGGLQDNGGSLLRTDMTDMVSNFGGDGGEIIVDPKNGCRIVGEYVGLTLYRTENCAKSKGDVATVTTIAPPDPAPRFIAPFGADIKNIEHWVAGGNVVWTTDKGWSTVSGDWVMAGSVGSSANGALRSSTAVAKSGNTIYAPWCGGGCNPGAAFERGVYKIKGAAKAQLPMTGLPNRYIDAVSIDPADSEHVYILFSGFSRKFAEGPGAAAAGEGHLYESTNGGQTWKLIDGSTAGFELPDVPGDDLQLLGGGKIVVGTDLGVFYSPDNGAKWYKLGGNLPATIVYDLHVGPDTTSAGDALYAGTHGRGIWKIALP